MCIPPHDRMRLERLLRYAGRPAIATERLSLLPDGRLLYRLKRRWRDGTTHVIYEPLELVERLAALLPPVTSVVRQKLLDIELLALSKKTPVLLIYICKEALDALH